ncbi:hypothetical protein BCV18_14845 [Vibrio cyclitrophicus]
MTNGDRVVTFRWYWCGCRPVSSTRYSTVAPSSVPPTVKLPSLVKNSSAAEPGVAPYQVSVLAHLELLCLE